MVAARPNFVKVAPVVEALRGTPELAQVVVHTGQHYDTRLSEDVRADVGLPLPDRYLGIGSGTHAEQTAGTLMAFESVLCDELPDMVVVAGDVNATLATALAAAKLGVPIAHIESGLRSGDWTMPEEINRVLVDRLASVLFTHSSECADNLEAEGIDAARVHFVGNTMIDSLRRTELRARELATWAAFGFKERGYVLVTLHRPPNVDGPDMLERIVRGLIGLARRTRVAFPMHPRTQMRLEQSGLGAELEQGGVLCLGALPYLQFVSLQLGAAAVVTDSGGVQEETSALGIPCYTLRATTDRPVTVTLGTNVLLGENPEALPDIPLATEPSEPAKIPLWDGFAGVRAAEVLRRVLALDHGVAEAGVA